MAAANSLTVARIFLVPMLVVVLLTKFNSWAPFELLAAGIFGIASLTDWADGYLARRRNQVTGFGQWMDPLADKLLVVSSFIALGFMGKVPRPLMIVVITRDVVILGGFLLTAAVVGKSMEMAPSLSGKLTTFTQLLSVTLVLIDLAQWWDVPNHVLTGVFIATACASIVSGSGYVLRGMKWYAASGPEA